MIVDFLLYLGKLLLLTLGTVTVCGLAVRLCAVWFAKLTGSGSGRVFDVTAAIGTPVHELGHAFFCLLFGHKITRMCLWSPKAENGMYGYVEHSYNRKNPWARLGNLFIGTGPIFSGLAVVVLILHLCYPAPWKAYLAASQNIAVTGTPFSELLRGIFSLFLSVPEAIAADPVRAILGLVVILPVSLHISLSWADIKGSASAMPLYLFVAVIFAAVTALLQWDAAVTSWLWLLNLRVLSLFALVIAFAAVWVLIALLVRLVRAFVKLF